MAVVGGALVVVVQSEVDEPGRVYVITLGEDHECPLKWWGKI